MSLYRIVKSMQVKNYPQGKSQVEDNDNSFFHVSQSQHNNQDIKHLLNNVIDSQSYLEMFFFLKSIQAFDVDVANCGEGEEENAHEDDS